MIRGLEEVINEFSNEIKDKFGDKAIGYADKIKNKD